MTPLRAIACLLAAGLGVWLLLHLGGLSGEAEHDPYAAESDPEPQIGGSMEAEVGLEGSAATQPAGEAEAADRTFRFVVRHAVDERVLGGVRIDDPETGYVGTSDDQGEFALTRPAEAFEFEATARGYLLTRGTARGGRVSVVYMTPGVPVSGVVLDAETRAAVPDAAIRTWDDDDGRFVTSTVPSDENGRFELLGVRLNHPFTLLVKVDGLVPIRSTHTVFEEGEDLEVFVGGAGTIHGRVMGLETEDEESVYVYLGPPGQRLPLDRRPHDPWSGPVPHTKQQLEAMAWTTFRTTTGEQGRFEIKGVPLDRPFQVVARVDAREQVRSEPLMLSSRKPTAEVVLGRGLRGSLKVVFIDELGGPMKRAQFELRGPYADFALEHPVAMDARGGHLYDDIPVGTYTLVASVPAGPRHHRRIGIEASAAKEVTIQSVAGSTLSGTVRGPGGEVVPGAKLRWVPDSDRYPAVEVVADRRGAFFMRGLIGRSYEFRVLPPPTYEAQSRYEMRDLGRVLAGQTGFRAELLGKPAFTGTVFGPRPIERVRVDVRTKRYRRAHWFDLTEGGRFTLPGLPEPEGLIVFRAKDFAPAFVEYGSYEEADQRLSRVWLEDPRKVLVTVHAQKGAPIAGAAIRPADARLDHVWRTDANGEAELAGLPPGRTRVLVVPTWQDPKIFEVQAALAGKRNHLTMGPTLGVVEGYIGARNPGAKYVVAFIRGSFRAYRRRKNKAPPPNAKPDASGWFSKRLPPGRYEVSLLRNERWPQHRIGRVKVRAGERTTLQPRR